MSFRQHPNFDDQTRGPALCNGCNSQRPPEDEFVFRFDNYIEFEGFFDVCGNCVRAMAHDLGWVSEARADQLVGQLASALEDVSALEARLQAAEEYAEKVQARLAEATSERNRLRREQARTARPKAPQGV